MEEILAIVKLRCNGDEDSCPLNNQPGVIRQTCLKKGEVCNGLDIIYQKIYYPEPLTKGE